MTLEEKQQEKALPSKTSGSAGKIIDEFAIFDDWIRKSIAFEDQTLVSGCDLYISL
ncbi:MAG: hypothetical protein HRT57_12685 [Crocinitomicaceae bacterium]|nr:hypothetical protein [Crocinitomicaceae bacterium]